MEQWIPLPTANHLRTGDGSGPFNEDSQTECVSVLKQPAPADRFENYIMHDEWSIP